MQHRATEQQRTAQNSSVRFEEAFYPHKDLTEQIIAAAIAVHKELGPGYLEQIYENALKIELEQRGHTVQSQVICDVSYRGQSVGRHRLDLLVGDAVVLELESVELLIDTHSAQLRSTLKAAGKRVGLALSEYLG